MKILPKGSREDWLAVRKNYIGSSEIAALFDVSPFTSKFALWHEKKGNYTPDIASKRMDAGTFLEDGIAKWWAFENSLQIEDFNSIWLDDVHKISATPDRFVITEAARYPLEIKNIDYKEFKEKWKEEPPIYYQLQLSQQMMLDGSEYGFIVACVGGNALHEYKIKYNPKIGDLIRKKVAEFWKSIEDGIEPKISSHNDLDIVKSLFKEGVGLGHIDLTNDNYLPSLAADLKEKSAKRLSLQKEEDRLKAEIFNKLGDYDTASCNGFFIAKSRKKGSVGTIITKNMLGQIVGAKKGSVTLTIKEQENE